MRAAIVALLADILSVGKMIIWPDITFPALNLWNYRDWLHYTGSVTNSSKFSHLVQKKINIHGVSITITERRPV